ncbi:unnamed protein product, partial [Lymnaea stagnalis]
MTKMYLDVFLFLTGFIAVVIGQGNGNTALLPPGEHIKQLLRSINVQCSDCSYSYEQVFTKSSFNAVCGAYFRFKNCISGNCYSNYRLINFQEADSICDASRENIKDVVRQANSQCGYCVEEYATVLKEKDLDHICRSFLYYKDCFRTNCSSVSVWDNVVDAVLICEAPEERLARLSYPYCDKCYNERSNVLSRHNISFACNAFFNYQNCISKTCNNVSTSISITEAKLICENQVESQKPILEIARDVNAKCDYCSRQYDKVRDSSFTDLCEPFFNYKDCILDHCYYFYKTTDFKAAESFCVQSTHTRGPSKLEGRIKQIVGGLDGRCMKCPDQYDAVITGNSKDEICRAFLSYKGCFLNRCYAYSSSYDIQEADSLCIA